MLLILPYIAKHLGNIGFDIYVCLEINTRTSWLIFYYCVLSASREEIVILDEV